MATTIETNSARRRPKAPFQQWEGRVDLYHDVTRPGQKHIRIGGELCGDIDIMAIVQKGTGRRRVVEGRKAD